MLMFLLMLCQRIKFTDFINKSFLAYYKPITFNMQHPTDMNIITRSINFKADSKCWTFLLDK